MCNVKVNGYIKAIIFEKWRLSSRKLGCESIHLKNRGYIFYSLSTIKELECTLTSSNVYTSVNIRGGLCPNKSCQQEFCLALLRRLQETTKAFKLPVPWDVTCLVMWKYILTSNAHKLTMPLLTTKRSFQVITACLFLKLNSSVWCS